MTRFTNLFAALALSGGVVAATVAACTSHPGSPGEAPPLAPRPEPAPSAVPVPGLETTRPPHEPPALEPDRGASALHHMGGASVQLAAVVRNPEPPTQPPDPNPTAAPSDAGVNDAYTPPLPPLPDAKLPVPIDAPAHPALGMH